MSITYDLQPEHGAEVTFSLGGAFRFRCRFDKDGTLVRDRPGEIVLLGTTLQETCDNLNAVLTHLGYGARVKATLVTDAENVRRINLEASMVERIPAPTMIRPDLPWIPQEHMALLHGLPIGHLLGILGSYHRGEDPDPESCAAMDAWRDAALAKRAAYVAEPKHVEPVTKYTVEEQQSARMLYLLIRALDPSVPDGLERVCEALRSTAKHFGPKPKQASDGRYPLKAILICPSCGGVHVDRNEWSTAMHHTHLCEHCSFEWRVEPYCVGVPVMSIIDEEDRQMVVLALAELSLRRPGWHEALAEIAGRYGSLQLFDGFLESSEGVPGVTPVEETALGLMVQKLADELRMARLYTKDAERLADEVDVLIARKVIDSRSPAADALLDMRSPNPRTERSSRLARLERERLELDQKLAAEIGKVTKLSLEVEVLTAAQNNLTAKLTKVIGERELERDKLTGEIAVLQSLLDRESLKLIERLSPAEIVRACEPEMIARLQAHMTPLIRCVEYLRRALPQMKSAEEGLQSESLGPKDFADTIAEGERALEAVDVVLRKIESDEPDEKA